MSSVPRSNRRRPDPPPRTPLGAGVDRTVSGSDGDWVVRELRGTSSTKTYRCPGCTQEIPPGVPHLVVWPSRGTFSPADGATERRHWHRACFGARGRRGSW
jgi:hypothetical protein